MSDYSALNLEVFMQNRVSMTTMQIGNLNQATLIQAADYVSGIGVYTRLPRLDIHNFQLGNGVDPQITASPWAGFGIGGTDWTGPIPANTWLAMYLVSDGTTANTYCCWSQSFQCPAINVLPNTPIYYILVATNRTNALGTAFEHSVIKVDKRSYYVGGTSGSPGVLPLITAGSAAMWTPINLDYVIPPIGGVLGVSLRAYEPDGSGIVGIAPNPTWGGCPTLYLNIYAPLTDAAIQGEVLTDGGNIGYWSQVSGGQLYATYFDTPC